MANYFDTSDAAVLNLLPDDIKCRDDLLYLATEAEAELIQHYSKEGLDYRGTALHNAAVTTSGKENLTTTDADPVVQLRYYKADADDLTSTDELTFKTKMRRAIAALIKVRAEQEDTDPLVRSETRGRRSVTYWQGANPLGGGVPKSVTKWLAPYDKRPRVFAI